MGMIVTGLAALGLGFAAGLAWPRLRKRVAEFKERIWPASS
jgi:hypothetical protein